jgi:hypothetical protein
MHRGGKLCGSVQTVSASQAEEVLAAVNALLAEGRTLLDGLAQGKVDRRCVDEPPAAKGGTL